jgi:tetratricopeptide (TPR) repeat protein
MAIKGSLREASLPDVLQLLAMGRKTGCLSVANRRQFGQIFFDAGRICYAAVVNRRDRLGDLLVKNGLTTHDALAAALEEQSRTPHRRIGEILISRGAITAEQLEEYIRLQIEEAVYFLFTWADGTFFFDPDQRPDEGSMLVSIHPENVLLEGARRVDEWSLIEKKIPSLDLIFAVDEARDDADGLELSDEQRRMLPLLDGRHSVAEIIDELGIVEFDGGKAIYGLIQAGLVQNVGKRERLAKTGLAASRIDEHLNLGIAFYRTRLYEEAAREFRRVLELDSRNRHGLYNLALTQLRRGDGRDAIRNLRALVEGGGPSVATLLALSVAFEQSGRLDTAVAAADEALRIGPGHAGALLSRAVLAAKLERFDEARAGFAAYREALGEGVPAAAYFAFATLAEAADGRLDAARAVGREGVELHPASAPLLLNVGAVHERSGDWTAAELLYRRACEEEPTLAQAHKSLGDSLYRRGAFGEAGDAYRVATQLAPGLGDDVYFKLGNIAYKSADRVEAVRLWRRALELNPANEVVRTNLEVVQSVLGEMAEPEPVPAAAGGGAPAGAAARPWAVGAAGG